MRHYEPLLVHVEGDKPVPAELNLVMWDDDQPVDPEHDCSRAGCTPPSPDAIKEVWQ